MPANKQHGYHRNYSNNNNRNKNENDKNISGCQSSTSSPWRYLTRVQRPCQWENVKFTETFVKHVLVHNITSL